MDPLPSEPATPPPASGLDAPPPLSHRPEFTGSGGEFFRIWIVNLFLTIITLGLYIPWARVRTRRYFYRHTRLDGHAFDYLARPTQLLIGYAIVGFFFLVYSLGNILSIWLTVGALVVFLLTFAWIRYKSVRFFANHSSYQNIRFQFHGTLRESYRIHLLLLALVPFSLGLLYPYQVHETKAYLFGNLAYGGKKAWFRGDAAYFYKIYLVAIAVLILAYVLLFGLFLGGILATVGISGAKPDEPELGPLAHASAVVFGLGLYLVPFLIFSVLGVLERNFCWNRLSFGHDPASIRFRSTLKASTYLGIQLGNVLLTLLTLGLYLPWAHVKLHRYRLSCLEVFGLHHVQGTDAGTGLEANAMGDTANDLFDIEFGL